VNFKNARYNNKDNTYLLCPLDERTSVMWCTFHYIHNFVSHPPANQGVQTWNENTDWLLTHYCVCGPCTYKWNKQYKELNAVQCEWQRTSPYIVTGTVNGCMANLNFLSTTWQKLRCDFRQMKKLHKIW
jgi:hypothetical protein